MFVTETLKPWPVQLKEKRWGSPGPDKITQDAVNSRDVVAVGRISTMLMSHILTRIFLQTGTAPIISVLTDVMGQDAKSDVIQT